VKALGGKIGNSICEDDKMELALEILKKLKKKEFKFTFQLDVVADSFSNDAQTQIVDVREIPGWQGLDAGPKSLENFKSNNGI
jgi:phosphoglycerate kinase